ncbi:MAG: helix-turn-helix transcriptional regulator [Oscillospiraceae bacterium]
MSNITSEVGQRIRNYRNQLHISQEELAEKCGLHPTYIGQVERGEKNATLETVEKIAAGLSIALNTLFEFIEKNDDTGSEYPAMAYKLIQSVSKAEQEKLIDILKSVMEFKHSN